MVSFNTLIAASLIASANAFKFTVWSGQNEQGAHHLEYYSCDGDEKCFNIAPPLRDNVRSYNWCGGGAADLTVYNGDDCSGTILYRENGVKDSVRSMYGANPLIKSFRVTGTFQSCIC